MIIDYIVDFLPYIILILCGISGIFLALDYILRKWKDSKLKRYLLSNATKNLINKGK